MQGIFERSKINALSAAVHTTSVKNTVIAENIVNMDTPGYKSRDLKFADVMGEVMGTGKKLPLARTNEKHIPPAQRDIDPSELVYQQNNPSVRNDGNDVNIDYEMSQMAENTIRYNMFTDMLAGKFSKLKSVIKLQT